MYYYAVKGYSYAMYILQMGVFESLKNVQSYNKQMNYNTLFVLHTEWVNAVV